MASGYFLYKKTSLDHFSIDPVRTYVMRMARLYITWNILYFPMAFTGFLDHENGMAYAAAAYIRNIILTGYGHLWYINATIFSVILITFLLSKKIKPKRILFLGFGFYVLGLFAQSWFGFIVPLKDMFPNLWKCLHLARLVIGSTRNGLFGGFLFVGIGMCFAFFDFKMERKKALFGFLISMCFLFLEAFVLESIGFIRAHEMYLSLVPATFFGFSFALEIKLPACKKGKTMRTVSALIYFTHIQIAVFVRNILLGISEPLEASALKFILTLAITVVFALLVIKISEKPRFAWLKKLYG